MSWPLKEPSLYYVRKWGLGMVQNFPYFMYLRKGKGGIKKDKIRIGNIKMVPKNES